MEARWLKRSNYEGVEEKFYPITHFNAIVMGDDNNLNQLKDLLPKVNKLISPNYTKYTISKNGWVGDSAPYTYTISDYNDQTIEVMEDVTMSIEQLEALENAKIKSNPMSDENILYAFGDKPKIDLPVLLRVL